MTTKLIGENVAERMASILLVNSKRRLLVRTVIRVDQKEGSGAVKSGDILTYLISTLEWGGKEGTFQAYYRSELKPSDWNQADIEVTQLPATLAEQDQWFAAQLLRWKETNPAFFTEEEVVEYLDPSSSGNLLRQEFHFLLVTHYSRLYGSLENYRNSPRLSDNFVARGPFARRLGAFLNNYYGNWFHLYGQVPGLT